MRTKERINISVDKQLLTDIKSKTDNLSSLIERFFVKYLKSNSHSDYFSITQDVLEETDLLLQKASKSAIRLAALALMSQEQKKANVKYWNDELRIFEENFPEHYLETILMENENG